MLDDAPSIMPNLHSQIYFVTETWCLPACLLSHKKDVSMVEMWCYQLLLGCCWSRRAAGGAAAGGAAAGGAAAGGAAAGGAAAGGAAAGGAAAEA